MNNKTFIIYQRQSPVKKSHRFLGTILITFSLAGLGIFFSPFLAPLFIKDQPVSNQVSAFGTLINEIVAPSEIELIKEKLNQDVLVLQTCWPRGTTLKRLLIFCQPSKFGSLI